MAASSQGKAGPNVYNSMREIVGLSGKLGKDPNLEWISVSLKEYGQSKWSDHFFSPLILEELLEEETETNQKSKERDSYD